MQAKVSVEEAGGQDPSSSQEKAGVQAISEELQDAGARLSGVVKEKRILAAGLARAHYKRTYELTYALEDASPTLTMKA